MPLGDVDAFHRWVKRATPALPVKRLVRAWIARLSDESWQAPSVPFPELSDQPTYEVRSAVVPGTDVEVHDKVRYGDSDGETVDLIWVG